MSVSIQELDNTVRAFYEGKGDVVSLPCTGKNSNEWETKRKKRRRKELTTHTSYLAKTSTTISNWGTMETAVSSTDFDWQTISSNSLNKIPTRGCWWEIFYKKRHTPRQSVSVLLEIMWWSSLARKFRWKLICSRPRTTSFGRGDHDKMESLTTRSMPRWFFFPPP